ncbi:LysR family transcriptional regulator [bacterium]|nr:LysR family transcriptional regulator [candidate division CSSED10-310 bacterium]
MGVYGKAITPRIKLFLSTSDVDGVFGEGKYRLLEAIRREGTLVAAARSLGRSYRKAWGDIRRAEEGFGRKLVERSRGGASKGKTELTPFAVSLINAWVLYRIEALKNVNVAFERYLTAVIDDPAEKPRPTREMK